MGEYYGGNDIFRGLALVVAIALGIALLGLAVFGTPDDRARADAIERQARADAEVTHLHAQAEMEAQRAAIRETEREASHQRALETLPYVVCIVGGVLVLGFGAFVAWDLHSTRHKLLDRAQREEAILLHLERLGLEQRQVWHVIARSGILQQRQISPSGKEKLP